VSATALQSAIILPVVMPGKMLLGSWKSWNFCNQESGNRDQSSEGRLFICVCWTVNGEPWLRPECSEVQQLRAELVTMRDNVERLINRLQLMTSFTATAASATVANDNDTAASDGQYPSNGQLPSNCDVALCHILHTHTTI